MKQHLLCVSLLVLQFCANSWCQSGSNETVDYDMDEMFTTQPPPSDTTKTATCMNPGNSGSGSGSGSGPGPGLTPECPTGMYVINNRTKFMWNIIVLFVNPVSW